MSNSVVVLTYFLITFVLPSFQEAASGHCSLDAALSYTGDNRIYLFKGDKYGVWNDATDTLESVGSKAKIILFLSFLCHMVF